MNERLKMREAATKFIFKNRLWIVTQLPALIMAAALVYNPAQWKEFTSYSGYLAVSFLVLTLSLNPIRNLQPQWVWILKLNRYRRQFGVASFSCALIHFTCFLLKKGSLYKAFPYFLYPAIIPAIWIAFPILFILALTSNTYSVKKLSFPKWKRLHKTVYVAEVAIVTHMILMGQLFFALCFFIPLGVLQFLRFKKDCLTPRASL